MSDQLADAAAIWKPILVEMAYTITRALNAGEDPKLPLAVRTRIVASIFELTNQLRASGNAVLLSGVASESDAASYIVAASEAFQTKLQELADLIEAAYPRAR